MRHDTTNHRRFPTGKARLYLLPLFLVAAITWIAIWRPRAAGAGGNAGTVSWGSSSAYDHLTAAQRDMIVKLRGALVRNNEENLPEAEARQLPHLFTRSMALRRVSALNGTEYRSAIAAGEPVIVTNGPSCTAHPWTLDYIRSVAGSDVVGVETSKSNRFYSNEGLRKEQMTVSQFLDVFTSPGRSKDYYLAEESLHEMPRLLADTAEPDFAEHSTVDKIQIWVGAGGQISPLHHDQWDNVLCQIRGSRKIILFDPLQVDRLYPKTGDNRHFSYVDPEAPDLSKFPRFRDAVRYDVELRAGEILVLPAYWWHQVHHGSEVNIAVNFWFIPTSLLAELLYDLILPP